MTVTTLDQTTEPILIEGLTWQEFKTIDHLLDRPGIRLSFLDGTLEIRKMPGRKHETVKQRISNLLDIFLEASNIDYTPTGSMTLESEAGQVKREADLSYELGPDRERPELAIEVVVTSGGIDKLEAYKRLKIPEVWFWQNGKLFLYALRQEEYEAIAQSELLPRLDLALLVRCITMPNHVQAVREFRQVIPS